jgi:hypothetical protein
MIAMDFEHNSVLSQHVPHIGLLTYRAPAAGLAWQRIVESVGAVHCAWVVRISLVVADAKRRLRKDAGKHALMRDGLFDLGEVSRTSAQGDRDR